MMYEVHIDIVQHTHICFVTCMTLYFVGLQKQVGVINTAVDSHVPGVYEKLK